jgi:hypothetical protein
VQAIVAASRKRVDTEEKARKFVQSDLDFAVSHTFGGHSPCVQIDTDGEDYVLCDSGTGARPFGNTVIASGAARAGDLPCLHVPCALGSHHGISAVHAGLPAEQPHPDLRLPRRARGGVSRQHGAPSFPVEFDQLAAKSSSSSSSRESATTSRA